MPHHLSDFADYDSFMDFQDEANADRIEDARREEAEDAFDAVAVTCDSCGVRYDPKRHRATRTDPAWVEVDACPSCGSDEITDGDEEPPASADPVVREVFREVFGNEPVDEAF